jgi:gas vesicle protein
MNSGKFAAGFLIGAAAGAVIGVLFAPAKGSETRHTIAKKSTDLINEFTDKLNTFKQDIAGKYNNAKDGLANKYHDLKDEAGDLMQEGKEKVASMKAGVKHDLS